MGPSEDLQPAASQEEVEAHLNDLTTAVIGDAGPMEQFLLQCSNLLILNFFGQRLLE